MEDTSDDFSRLSLGEIAGNRVKLLNRIQQQLRNAIDALNAGNDFSLKERVGRVLQQVIKNLDVIKVSCNGDDSSSLRTVGKVTQEELTSWERLGHGEGGFSSVYKAKLKGNDVAVKVLKNRKETKSLLTEGNLLRDLHHDNIVGFRGMSILECDVTFENAVSHEKYLLKAGSPFLVMEYIPKNLYRFVEDHKTPESQGLPKSQVWTISRGMANGLMYLHSLNPPISHRDLKPDNILLDVRSLRVKLADFGLSRTVERSGNDLSLFHARWTAPEVWDDYIDDGYVEEPLEEPPEEEEEEYTDFDDKLLFYLRADIYSYGQVLAYTLTGNMPWQGQNSVSVKGIQNNLVQKTYLVKIPEELTGILRNVILDCCVENPELRPTADQLVLEYFGDSSGLRTVGKVSQEELTSWERLSHGEGGFSSVYKAKLKGNDVAVKVLKNLEETKSLLTEGNLLRDLRHDNIVAFRGMSILECDVTFDNAVSHDPLKAGSPFLVMEYIPKNLYRFVEDHKTPESQGLPKSQVWTISRGMANGLMYLHSLNPPISHQDLKPDNILLDVRTLRVKLADFGLSRANERIIRSENDLSLFHARWTAPERWDQYCSDDDDCIGDNCIEGDESLEELPEEEEYTDLDDELFYLRADIYSYGQVVAYTLTGNMPWQGRNSVSVIGIRNNWVQKEDQVKIPEELTGKLRNVILDCRVENPGQRPTADKLVLEYFSGDTNPYQTEATSAEFFSCGFLQHTYIFVAESLVDESSEGFFKTRVRPQGFPTECLLCEVEVGNEEYNTVPKEWVYEQKYRDNYAHFRQAAIDKTIEDNPAIALKSLVTSREEEEERQEIQLKFGQSTYCHHRAVREIWRNLEDSKKRELVVCKNTVHPVFSTSFGLHVAVLTADSPQKFIFARRANREGMATPGKFTCGAVESASVKDYIDKDGKPYVDLIQTAARGLEEELRVELKESDIEALCLTTVYLKFDTHEWGCCGYVDLSDERVAPERRLTFEQLGSRFTTGPKDKFEHEEVKAVDFELPRMVEFVRENYIDFASSTKLVVVKVLQSFFGVAAVERAFRVYMEEGDNVLQGEITT